MTRFLLLGASGFLGQHVLRALNEVAGADVVAAGHSSGHGLVPDLRVDLTGEISDLVAMLHRVEPDVVVNCSGVTAGDAAAMAAGNVVGPANLVEALLLGSSSAVRLVHLGSAAEYGRTPSGVAVDEHAPERPVGVYGVSKLAGTRLVRAAVGLDPVVLRVANPLGPGSPPTSLAGRVAAELRRVVGSDSPLIVGPLEDVRDFVDVRDVAEAVVAAATHRAPSVPRVLNVGSGRPTPVRAVVDGLAEVAGFTGEIRVNAEGSPRSAAVPWQQTDISAIGAALDWTPSHDLGSSLHDLWHAAAPVG